MGIISPVSLNPNREKWDSKVIRRLLNVTTVAQTGHKGTHFNLLESKEHLTSKWVHKLSHVFSIKQTSNSQCQVISQMYLPVDWRCQTTTLCSQENGGLFFYSVCNIHSSTSQVPGSNVTPLTILLMSVLNIVFSLNPLFSCTDSREQKQLHPVLPQLGLVGQQTGETGIFIRYYGKHIFSDLRGNLFNIQYVLIMTNILSDLLGILEVLHCILVESPEALNIIQRAHIKSIISLLYKHGRNHKVGRNMSAVAWRLAMGISYRMVIGFDTWCKPI